jgi:hypothetical protein
MSIRPLLNPPLKLCAAALVLLCALLLLSPKKTSAGPPAHKAVLVELFTSEGCSSCPPADALLGRLRQEFAGRGFEVIPLGFHVDYWNSLGWKDRFSAAEFSRRQEQYARALRVDGPYTPQMVVDGETEFVGSESARASAAIAEAANRSQRAQIELSLSALDKLTVKASSAENGAQVMLAITEDNLSTKVGAGENNGRELHHAAVVRELHPLGKIQNGSFATSVPLAMAKEWKPADLRAVVSSSRAKLVGCWARPQFPCTPKGLKRAEVRPSLFSSSIKSGLLGNCLCSCSRFLRASSGLFFRTSSKATRSLAKGAR